MDLHINNLPAEMLLAILDRVALLEWILSLTLVCKKWRSLRQTSRSSSKNLVLTDYDVKQNKFITTSIIRNIVLSYQASGLDISHLSRLTVDVPWSEVLTASKQLKWLSIDIIHVKNIASLPEVYDIERLGVVKHHWWDFSENDLPKGVLFLSKFPKVKTFGITKVFSYMNEEPNNANWNINSAPPNTEVLHTSHVFKSSLKDTYYFLDRIVKNVPQLKKLILDLSTYSILGSSPIDEYVRIYTELETYMKDTYNVRLIARNLFDLICDVEQLKEAYYMNGAPYNCYMALQDKEDRGAHYTLFCHACNKEQWNTMKFLIESGITSLENELRFVPLPHEGYNDRLLLPRNYGAYHAFCLPLLPFRELNEIRKDVLDFFIAHGLTCTTKGKNGESILQAFGVEHPVVEYVVLRSPPKLAAQTVCDMMETKSAHYKTYMALYTKLSKEAQDELKKLLVDFDFTNVIYYVIESRDLQLIKHVVEEFNIDMNKYEDTISEWYVSSMMIVYVKTGSDSFTTIFSRTLHTCVDIQEYISLHRSKN